MQAVFLQRRVLVAAVAASTLAVCGPGCPGKTEGAPAPTTGPWSPLVPLTGGGAIGSPGGTHPLVTDGDVVRFVWVQDGCIYYRRSDDAGKTWTEPVPLTSGGTAVYPCSLELTGTALHLIWPDSRHDGRWEIYYRRSPDGGKTWEPETRLTHGVDLFRMGTAACGEALYMVWGGKSRLEKVAAGPDTWTWTWGEISYMRSPDGGRTWEQPVRLTRPSGSAQRPAIAASGPYVHVAWIDERDAAQEPPWDWEVYYKRSTDGGATWGPDVRMSRTPEHTRHPQIVVTPGRVCCLWEDGQVFNGTGMEGDPALYAGVSSDDGETWTEPRRLTFVNAPHGFATHCKAYACGARIHLAWQDAPEGDGHPRATYYMTSPDGGLTWDAPVRLTAPTDGESGAEAVAGTESYALVICRSGDKLVCTRCDLGH